MNFRLEKDFEHGCSGDSETCEITASLYDDDSFYAAAEHEENDVMHRLEAGECRKILSNLLDMCTNGTCPGQNIELVNQYIRKRDS